MCPLLPDLDQALAEVKELAGAGAGALVCQPHSVHVTEVILPVLCSYMSLWWRWGPEGQPDRPVCTSVSPQCASDLLGYILQIIQNHMGISQGDWMKQMAGIVALPVTAVHSFLFSTPCMILSFPHYTPSPSLSVYSQSVICHACPELLKSHFLPLMEKLKKRAECLLLEEEQMRAEGGDNSEAELQIQEKFTMLVRDLYAFYPLLIPFVDSNRYEIQKSQMWKCMPTC